MTLMMPALMLIMNLVSILIIWVGASKINDGSMQVGDMMAFIQYTMQIIMSFLMLTMISVMLPRAGVAAKRIDEVLTVDGVIKDPETEELADISKKGILEFKKVNFRYPNAEEDVLSDLNFVAKPGETTAIIGSTGSGKTSLINLIPRFYDITSGSIEIDGQDIRRFKLRTLRNKLGFVPQKGILFSGSIESNIAYGKPNSPKEVVTTAARIAQATEFIEAKPEGYEAPISQGGTNVSGGQKQRLSIARAIAKNPEIYIFDDSFSALDYKTDSALRKALKEELSESTVIIVAQRISTIMHAEQILVLDEGRIVGKGTHRELLKDCEVYRQIASSQLSKEELDYE
jgi:ATP-binding cassette subfamily B protein